jgi:hypothetical protein
MLMAVLVVCALLLMPAQGMVLAGVEVLAVGVADWVINRCHSAAPAVDSEPLSLALIDARERAQQEIQGAREQLEALQKS